MNFLVKDLKQLQKPCQKITLKKGLEVSRELFHFLEKYNKAHRAKPGIGLAANQLGIDASVCVLLLNRVRLALVNPEVIRHSAATVNTKEGCLSFPGKEVDTQRYIWVEITSENLRDSKIFGVDLTRVTNKTYEQMLLESVCVQHEICHLRGLTIFDKTLL